MPQGRAEKADQPRMLPRLPASGGVMRSMRTEGELRSVLLVLGQRRSVRMRMRTVMMTCPHCLRTPTGGDRWHIMMTRMTKTRMGDQGMPAGLE